MVSRRMERLGKVAAELDANIYRAIAGELRKNIPVRLKTEIERAKNDQGEKVIKIWCQYPQAIDEVINELISKHMKNPVIEEEIDKENEFTAEKNVKLPPWF